jgi:hypothetical protein
VIGALEDVIQQLTYRSWSAPRYAGRGFLVLVDLLQTMSEDDTDREQGVDFTDIDPVLEDISYPITADELVDEYGDQTIERTNAEPITIRELFAPMGEDTFESPEEIQQGILNLMPEDSVGREGYSDRGGSFPEETEEAERRGEEDESL